MFVRGDNFVRILVCSFVDDVEERRVDLVWVDDECRRENFVGGVLRVNVWERE